MSNFKSRKKIKFDYIKSILTSLAIPIGYLWLWYVYYPSTLNEFLLLTNKSEVANGYITKAEEIEDYVEFYEGRRIEKTLDFNFEYIFTLSNGKTITSYGSEVGALPDVLSNVSSKPYAIQIEYLPDNPETNRVKASWTGEKSLFQWFRQKVFIELIIFILCCSLALAIFKTGKKNYQNEISENDKAVHDYYSNKYVAN